MSFLITFLSKRLLSNIGNIIWALHNSIDISCSQCYQKVSSTKLESQIQNCKEYTMSPFCQYLSKMLSLILTNSNIFKILHTRVYFLSHGDKICRGKKRSHERGEIAQSVIMMVLDLKHRTSIYQYCFHKP